MGQASGGGAGFMADVWSFGVVVWEIYTGKLPWAGMPATQVSPQQYTHVSTRTPSPIPLNPPPITHTTLPEIRISESST